MTNDLIVIDEGKVALIKRTVAKDASDDELELFLYQARRMGLDPLARQIHFQKFKSKSGKDNVSFITTIDGYRLIADRTGKYAGSGEPVYEGKITDQNYGAGTGPVIPAKATVTVFKIVAGEVRPFTNSAYWQEYYPGKFRGHMWRKMPHVMLAKVAEAGALRKAFPADLSGAYTADEMDQAVVIDGTPHVDIEREKKTLDAVIDIELEREAHEEESPEPAPEAKPAPTQAKNKTTNGNGSVKQAGPLPDDEQVIYEGAAGDFWVNVLALIDRYTHIKHAQAAAKKLGFTVVPGTGKERLAMYRALKVEAADRDAEEAAKIESTLNQQGKTVQ